VVEVIRERFDLYYVGLFLTDEIGKWAVLQAGTGEAGRSMLARGHRLRVSGDSMIGWSIAHSQARIALEAEEDPVRLATPELPDTRSEAALPLRSRGQVLGALTVQSEQSEAFDQDTIAVLQTMVDQVAVAIDNAHLFSEAEAALEATRRAYSELSREGWSDLLRAQSGLGYRSGKRGVTCTEGIRRSELEQALQTNASFRSSEIETEDKHPLAVPVKVRGNVVGMLDTYKPSEAGEWTPEETRLLEALAEQVGVALESARLYRDAQRRAAHERLVGEITDKMRRAADIDILMETTIREIATALDVPNAFVQFSATPGMGWDADGD
jgi:GAF domain-containing protein